MPNPALPEIPPPLLGAIVRVLIDGLFRPLVGSLCLLLAIAMTLEAYDFWRDPNGYIVPHDLDVTQPLWQLRFIVKNILLFVAAGLTIGLVLASYSYPRQRLLRWSCRMVVTLAVAVFAFNVYQMVINDFDY